MRMHLCCPRTKQRPGSAAVCPRSARAVSVDIGKALHFPFGRLTYICGYLASSILPQHVNLPLQSSAISNPCAGQPRPPRSTPTFVLPSLICCHRRATIRRIQWFLAHATPSPILLPFNSKAHCMLYALAVRCMHRRRAIFGGRFGA